MISADVVVIGGGLHGCSAALHLARAGARVAVLEKDHVARHASGVNAGGVRRLGRHFAEVPLAVASAALWGRISDLVDDGCGFEASGQLKVAESDAELAALRERVKQLYGDAGSIAWTASADGTGLVLDLPLTAADPP